MADKSLKFVLDFLAKTAGLKDAVKVVEQLGDELDDTTDKGKAMAAGMKLSAAKAAQDLDEVTQMADQLGRALGPEMAEKLGQSRLTQIASDWQKVGLSVKDVEQNVDALADGVRAMDMVADRADGVGRAMRRVGEETDNSRSVMANFAGNAVQELPGVAGAFGPLNMAASQFVEYATEGNIALGNLLKFAGPIAGVALAVSLVSREFSEAADRKKELEEFDASQLETFTEAIKDNESATSALVKQWEDAGKVMAHVFATGPFGGRFGGVTDLTEELANAGITLDIFAEASTGGAEGLAMLDQLLQRAGVSGEQYEMIMSAATTANENLAKQQENAAIWAKLHGDALKGMNLDAFAGDVTTAKRAMDELGGATDDAAAAIRGFPQHGPAVQAMEAIRDAAGETVDYVQELQDLLSGLDRDEAVLNMQDSFDNLKTAAQEYYDAVKNGDEDAEEKHRTYQRALIDSKRKVEDLSDAVLGLPPQQTTEFVAMIDQGSYDLAMAALKAMANQITVPVVPVTYVGGKPVTGIGNNKGTGKGQRGLDGATATGGPVRAGGAYLVNEGGDEILVMGSRGGHVLNAQESQQAVASALGGGSGGGTTVVQLMLNDRVLQEIAVRQGQLNRGRR